MATRTALTILFLALLFNSDSGKAEFEMESPGNTKLSDEAQELRVLSLRDSQELTVGQGKQCHIRYFGCGKRDTQKQD
ncbi:unnamed protein product [Cyprideis torosa]|uniref:Uncharacterized protein n=1 Tax=Cyprideis torosa TaxID=163714 RepID=A0A7R8WEP0_9CRUS|nr:unnamed protein product [Cyprideis torosa]CAG0896061.1 unnamed protein product [Cyprideis torosa]